ncbi:MAG: hypothetical protein E7050_03285 [Lentisphaerae bacterium]|nr:hypothetical protein [Lentisphaerota bacterium]
MVIKKLNTLFHKHSRVLFGAFTILIILAFTDFLTPGNVGGCDDPAETEIGTAYGEKVTAGDLQKLHHDLSVLASLQGVGVPDDTKALFDHLCFIKRAEQLGIYVTDAEVADMIAKCEKFQKDGKFSQLEYDNFLKNNRMSNDDVVAALRTAGLVDKLQKTLLSSVVVTDDEAKDLYIARNPGLDVAVKVFNAADFKVADGDDAALAKFYEAHKADYMTSGTAEIVKAVISYANFQPEAEKMFASPDARVTKMIADAKAAKADASDEDIKKAVVADLAAELAASKAATLARGLYDKLDSKLPAAEQLKFFLNWAAENGLEIHESGKLAFNSPEMPPQLANTLKTMSRTGLQLLSTLIAGENGIEVIMLKDRVEPVQQEFAAVKELVKTAYKADAQQKAAVDAADTFRKNMEAVDAGKRVAAWGESKEGKALQLTLPVDNIFQILQDGTLKEVYQMFYPEQLIGMLAFMFPQEVLQQIILGSDEAVESFIAQYPPAQQASLRAMLKPVFLMREAGGGMRKELQMKEGDVSQVIEIPGGAAVFCIAKRTPADMSKFEAAKGALVSELKDRKGSVVMQEFFEESARQCRFTFVNEEAAPVEK